MSLYAIGSFCYLIMGVAIAVSSIRLYKQRPFDSNHNLRIGASIVFTWPLFVAFVVLGSSISFLAVVVRRTPRAMLLAADLIAKKSRAGSSGTV